MRSACRIFPLLWLAFVAPSEAWSSGREARNAWLAGDYEAALPLARSAAEQNDAEAMNVLGLMHYNGHGVPKDYRAALHWWELSARLGDCKAQHNLGMMYESGYGVERTPVEAFRLFQKSADQGCGGGFRGLARMRATGGYFLKDPKEALVLYRKALDHFEQELVRDPDNRPNLTRQIEVVRREMKNVEHVIKYGDGSTPPDSHR